MQFTPNYVLDRFIVNAEDLYNTTNKIEVLANEPFRGILILLR